MRLSDRVAHFIVHRPFQLWMVVVVLVAMSLGLILVRARLHSDVLEMLPAEFESVQYYKLADREFSSARDLMFGLEVPNDSVDLDGFADHFVEELRKEPWVERVMNGFPISSAPTPEDYRQLRALALPLILDQDEAEFAKTVAALKPEAIRQHLAELFERMPTSFDQVDAAFHLDAVGIVGPALKALGNAEGFKQDPLFRLVHVHCVQEDLNEPACRATMEKVENFRKRVLASWEGPAPAIYCTGRTAYVAEMASKLKSDIISTVSASILLVALTFFVGFRQWKPLRAIVEALVLTCLLAVACGAILFGALNMITIGLCSLLVGLGVDFAMVLYSLYMHERAHGRTHEESIAAALHAHGRGIWFGAMTTAAAFLCLMASGSPGYKELGVLIACGILLAAAVMMTFLWLFLSVKLPKSIYRGIVWLARVAALAGIVAVAMTISSWSTYIWQNVLAALGAAAVATFLVVGLGRLTAKLPDLVFSKPWRLLGPALAVLGMTALFALAPVGMVTFDINPKTLEPRPSDAGDAMRVIMDHLNPRGLENIWAVVEAPDREAFSTAWKKADAAWQKLKREAVSSTLGIFDAPFQAWQSIKDQSHPPGAAPLFSSITTMAGLATSPARMKTNAARLKPADLEAAKETLRTILTEHQFNLVEIEGTMKMLDALGEAAKGHVDAVQWQNTLSKNSAWWFLVDACLSDQRPLGRAILAPIHPIETAEDAAAVRRALTVPGVKVGFSGWGFTLVELKPWSQQKMLLLTGMMVGINSMILFFLLRQWKPVAVIMLGLALGVAGMFVTLKLTGLTLNLFNVLAFPLVLGVGVDYSIYATLAVRAPDPVRELKALMKPLLLSGLTTVIGFTTLAWSYNPALRGLGILCGVGVGWCMLTTFVFVLPIAAMMTGGKRKMEAVAPVVEV